jgi:tetratricopeptide (TPR) repeat protein
MSASEPGLDAAVRMVVSAWPAEPLRASSRPAVEELGRHLAAIADRVVRAGLRTPESIDALVHAASRLAAERPGESTNAIIGGYLEFVRAAPCPDVRAEILLLRTLAGQPSTTFPNGRRQRLRAIAWCVEAIHLADRLDVDGARLRSLVRAIAAERLTPEDPARGLALAEWAYREAESRLAAEDPDRWRVRYLYADALRANGLVGEALDHARQSVDRLEELFDEPHSYLVWALSYLGLAATRADDLATSLRAHERAHELSRRLAGSRRTRSLALRSNNLAVVLDLLGRPDEALPLAEDALSITRELGIDGPTLSLRLGRVGDILSALDRDEEAERHLRESVVVMRRSSDPRATRRTAQLCTHLLKTGRVDEADQLLDNALASASDPWRPEDSVRFPRLQGEIHTRSDRWDEARLALDVALAGSLRVFSEQHRETAACWVALSELDEATGDLTAARTRSRQALGVLAARATGNLRLARRARRLAEG